MVFAEELSKDNHALVNFRKFPAPVLNMRYMNIEILYSELLKKKNQEEIKFDFLNDPKPIVDLVSFAIFQDLRKHFSNSWSITKRITKGPTGRTEQWGPKNDRKTKKDIKTILNENLPMSLKKNIFYTEASLSNKITLPKRTEFKYEVKERLCKFIMKKPFYFNLVISVKYDGATIGLGRVGDYIGVTDFERKYTDVRDPNVRKYRTHMLEINCNAKFYKWTAGNPKTEQYKEWVKFMFDRISDQLDWEKIDKEIKENKQQKAMHKIIKFSDQIDNK